MNAVRNKAVSLLISCEIDRMPLTFEDLQKISEKLSCRLMTYEQGAELIAELGCGPYLEQGAIYAVCRDCRFIFYSSELPYQLKLFTIAHEIGHLYLGHAYEHHADRGGPGESVRKALDLEAGRFARYLFGPLPVLKKFRPKTVEEIQRFTLLPKEQALEALTELEHYRPSIEERKLYKWYGAFLRAALAAEKRTGKWPLRRAVFAGAGAAAVVACAFLLPRRAMLRAASEPGGREVVLSSSVSRSVSEEEAGGWVLVTQSGARYHKEGCTYLKKKSDLILMTEEEAMEKGLLPCKVCFSGIS